ncbi:hypothetical protein ACFSX9_06590 [Flavobacterium ardleyense]|uniref:Uncharacterized protein n=1 Tax=Flavobacterium ardleyense TaxID=2038737 RepID=A0ABW5Z6R9_9FLAO
MKYLFIFFFFAFSVFSFAQSNVLVIQKNNSNRTIEIKENKRIKVETTDGEKLYGRFTVIDSSSILIKEKIVLLEDVVTMKRKSLFGTIANPVFIVYGSVMVIAGITTVGTGGLGSLAGAILLVGGLPVLIIPLVSNLHPVNDWNYSIKTE